MNSVKMRNIVLSICLIMLFVSVKTGKCQDEPLDKNNIIKIDLFCPVVSCFSIAYERLINSESSFQVELRVFEDGIAFTPEYRYYLSKDPAPKGIFLAPFIRVGTVTSLFDDNSNFGGGLVVGVQTVLKKISIEAYLGPAYYESPVVRGGINVGLQF
ncbi:hypothetical protein ES705_39777 [subsurface metagenome]